MLYVMIKKELRELVREGRFRWAIAVLVVLLMVSLFVSRRYYEFVNTQHTEARQNARQEWVSQEKKNPHSAAHYGTYAFKPKYPLSLLDQGVDKYSGVSIFLEAHRRNEAQYMAAQDQTALARFGDLTPDFILIFIIPLFIIFIGFNAFSRERESGTLRLLLSQGAGAWKVLLAKWVALFIPVVSFLALVLLLSGWLLGSAIDFGEFQWGALAGLIGIYLVYYLVFINITLFVSAFTKRGNTSLVALLAVWMVACLAMPKVASSLADKWYPYPTQLEFEEQIARDKKAGLNGHDPWGEASKKLEQETLAQYNVSRVEDLPFNWNGFLMQKGEEHEAEIYFTHYQMLKETFEKQSRVYRATAALSPYLPTRFLSMGVCRTDYHAHWDFANAAERYRLELVGKLNGDLMNNSKTGDWAYEADAKLWQAIPEFQYQPLSYSAIINIQKSNLLTLAVWVLISFFALRAAVHQLKP